MQGTNRSSAGHLEICHKYIWGVICANNWELFEAHVACRQLGFDAERAIRLRPGDLKVWQKAGNYSKGSGPREVWLDNAYCKGTEMELLSCSSKKDGLMPLKDSPVYGEGASRLCFVQGEIVGVDCQG